MQSDRTGAERRKPWQNPKTGEREPGIYFRPGSNPPVFEIGYKDQYRKQKWETVKSGGITAARAQRRAAQVRVAQERLAPHEAPSNLKLTFAEAADAWWTSQGGALRPKTVEAYQGALKHLLPVFGRRRLTEIEPRDVAKYVQAKQATLKGWSIRGHLVVLGSVFDHAAWDLGYRGVNPVRVLPKKHRPSTSDAKPQRALTPDEMGRLLGSVDDEHRLLFEFAADTGARLSEVLALTWGNVDFSRETVSLTHQLSRKGEREPLKTDRSRRTLEIAPGLVARLREAKMSAPRSGRHDYVFATRAGTAYDQRNVAGRVLSRAVKRAGLEDARDARGVVVEHAPTFHTLRHTHGSALIAAGADIEEVSARLGHADTTVTLKSYVHEFNAANRQDERRSRIAGLSVVAEMVTTDGSKAQETAGSGNAKVTELRGIAAGRQ